MWIVAGPNGAGKSTFTAEYLRENVLPPGILKLNADEVTVEYRKTDKDSPQDDLNLRAARFASRTGLEAFHKRGVNPMIDAAMRQAFPAGS